MELEINYLNKLMPDWRTDSNYTEAMFTKGAKDKDIKTTMINVRVYYNKNSKKQAGCFCTRGMKLIIEWLIKRIKQYENKNNSN